MSNASSLDNYPEILESLLQVMESGMLVCDTQSKVVVSNPVMRDYFKATNDDCSLNDWFSQANVRHVNNRFRVQYNDELVDVALSGTDVPVQHWRVAHAKSEPTNLKVTCQAIRNKKDEIIGALLSAVKDSTVGDQNPGTGHHSLFDSLTELPGRSHLIGRLQQELAAAVRHGTIGAVLFLNIDKFRSVNDSLGSAVGDDLLRRVAQRMSQEIREEDTIARIGADEFACILPQLDENEEDAIVKAQAVADKMLNCFVEDFHIMGFNCKVTASVGVILFPTASNHVDEILKHADVAMHRAKKEGNNRCCFFNINMQEIADRLIILRRDVATMIEKKEFEVHFQPLVNTAEDAVIGAESLARWSHPKYGALSPAEFIPIAEDTGVIHMIGNWVLMHALRSLKHWISTGLTGTDMAISVNISPMQLDDPDFVQYVMRALSIFELQPYQLKLEITEGIVLSDMQDPIAKMKVLKEQGVRFSIDDFGTGYSSLHYIKHLPVDQLKIDKSFVQDVDSDENDVAITRTIMSVAKHFGLEVVAEGVERVEQLEVLQGLGCTIFQGYYFARPMSSNDFVSWLKQRVN